MGNALIATSDTEIVAHMDLDWRMVSACSGSVVEAKDPA
jgi:hypothetical protein